MAVCRYVSIGLLLLVFFSAAVAESVYVFDDYNSKKDSTSADDCHDITVVLTTVMACLLRYSGTGGWFVLLALNGHIILRL